MVPFGDLPEPVSEGFVIGGISKQFALWQRMERLDLPWNHADHQPEEHRGRRALDEERVHGCEQVEHDSCDEQHQAGEREPEERREAAKAAGLDCVLSAGKLSQAISQASGVGEHFADKTALIARLKALITEKQIVTVLVKGSRSAAMEEVVHALQENGTC